MTICEADQVIEFEHVWKSFAHHGGRKLLRAHIEHRLRNRRTDVFHALKDVSFRVSAGESLALIGSNGAGKSTLLSLVAKLAKPTSGRVQVTGKTAVLMELGSGFHPDLTGRENVRLNASLLGLSRCKTDRVFERIVEFSGIGDFINEPVRTFSSGMLMRLAFSVAIHVDPDILIIDEVLAVGDEAFQAKCFQQISDFRRAGKTLLFVSHNPKLVRELCDRAIWLDNGSVMLEGMAAEVLEAYSGHRSPSTV